MIGTFAKVLSKITLFQRPWPYATLGLFLPSSMAHILTFYQMLTGTCPKNDGSTLFLCEDQSMVVTIQSLQRERT